MPALTLYEEVENVLTNRLKNALRTDEVINAPDWASDLAACLALIDRIFLACGHLRTPSWIALLTSGSRIWTSWSRNDTSRLVVIPSCPSEIIFEPQRSREPPQP